MIFPLQLLLYFHEACGPGKLIDEGDPAAVLLAVYGVDLATAQDPESAFAGLDYDTRVLIACGWLRKYETHTNLNAVYRITPEGRAIAATVAAVTQNDPIPLGD